MSQKKGQRYTVKTPGHSPFLAAAEKLFAMHCEKYGATIPFGQIGQMVSHPSGCDTGALLIVDAFLCSYPIISTFLLDAFNVRSQNLALFHRYIRKNSSKKQKSLITKHL